MNTLMLCTLLNQSDPNHKYRQAIVCYCLMFLIGMFYYPLYYTTLLHECMSFHTSILVTTQLASIWIECVTCN